MHISFLIVLIVVATTVQSQRILLVPSNFSTVSSAALAAQDGDIIQLAPNLQYTCNVRIPNALSKLTIMGDASGQSSIFNCNGQSRAFFLSSNSRVELSFRNLGFTGGYDDNFGSAMALFAASDSVIDIQNCTFWNNTSSGSNFTGGAVYISASTPTTTVSLNVSVSNSHFSGPSAIVISRASSNTFISVSKGCSFTSGAAAISASFQVPYPATSIENVEIDVSDSNFFGNKNAVAILFGGACSRVAISVSDANFVGNSGQVGGGIQISFHDTTAQTSVSISRCLFHLNAALALNSGGGGVAITYNSDLLNSSILLDRCSFVNNTAVGGSAGIDLRFGGTSSNTGIIFRNSLFANNTAFASGGAGANLQFVTQQGDAAVTIANCTFIANFASGLGGGMNAVLPAGNYIKHCQTCELNPIDGLFYPPTFPECRMPPNPVYCTQNQKTTTAIPNSVQNVFVPYSYPSSFAILNSTFLGNMAICVGCAGGGIVVVNGYVTTMNAYFIQNTATQQAGGMYNSGVAQMSIYGMLGFIDNSAQGAVTAFSATSPGSVSVLGTVFITVSAPTDFFLDQGSFNVASFSGVGNISVLPEGSVYVQCPGGFRYEDASVGFVPTYVAGWPNQMITSFNTTSCIACGANTYSIVGGSAHLMGPLNISADIIQCLPCPFGGVCTYGVDAMLVGENYWGTMYVNPEKNALPMWIFTRCPLGYCCNDEGGCTPLLSDYGLNAAGTAPLPFSSPNSTAEEELYLLAIRHRLLDTPTCALGRNASVPLCGACLSGFSQDLRGQGCSKDEDCNEGRWVWPVMILGALCWGFMLVATSSPNSGENRLDTSWFVPTMLFFYQNISLLFVAGGSRPKPIVAAVSAITNLHLSGSEFRTTPDGGASPPQWTKMCTIRDLSTEGAISLQLILPAVVGVMMIFSFLVLRLLFSRAGSRISTVVARFYPAGLKLVVFFYTSIASVTGTLLHCVQVHGRDDLRVIFRAGGIACYTSWQKGLIVVFVLLIAPFPFILFSVQLWLKRRKSQCQASRIVGVLEKPYRPERWYWPSVILFRRLLVALVFSFVEDPSVQGIWFAIIFGTDLMIHLQVSPHKSCTGHIVEGLTLAVLTLVSLFIIRQGSFAEAAIIVPPDSQAPGVTDRLEWVETILFFAPITMAVVMLGYEWVCYKRGWKLYQFLELFKKLDKKLETELTTLTYDDMDSVIKENAMIRRENETLRLKLAAALLEK